MSAPSIATAQRWPATAWYVTLWVLQIAAAAMFLFSGGMKLAATPEMVQLFDEIGVGQWLRYLTGGLEVIGAVALLIPRFVAHGAVLLAAVMVGAVVTDLFVLGATPVPALVLLVVTAVIAWGRRDRIRTALGR